MKHKRDLATAKAIQDKHRRKKPSTPKEQAKANMSGYRGEYDPNRKKRLGVNPQEGTEDMSSLDTTPFAKGGGVRSPKRGHTLKQLKHLNEHGWHNPDTNYEMSEEEGTTRMHELMQNKADREVEAYERQMNKKTHHTPNKAATDKSGKAEAMGSWKTKPKSEHRAKHIEAASKYIKNKFGMSVERAPGKLNASGKHIDKPDLTNERGAIQHIGNPDSLLHEMGHMVVAPKHMPLAEFQRHMDKKWGEYNKPESKGGYGYKQHARTKDEYETTALENPLRRRMGLPAHQKETKEANPKRMMAADVPGKKIVHETPQGKKLTGTSQNISPEARQRLRDIDEKITRYHDKKGMTESHSGEALINLRGQGRHEEAKHRLKTRGKDRFAKGGVVDIILLKLKDKRKK